MKASRGSRTAETSKASITVLVSTATTVVFQHFQLASLGGYPVTFGIFAGFTMLAQLVKPRASMFLVAVSRSRLRRACSTRLRPLRHSGYRVCTHTNLGGSNFCNRYVGDRVHPSKSNRCVRPKEGALHFPLACGWPRGNAGGDRVHRQRSLFQSLGHVPVPVSVRSTHSVQSDPTRPRVLPRGPPTLRL